jgi:hypothetical protein
MSVMAEKFSGLASMPHFDMTRPRSMLLRTPKTHFLGLSFTLCSHSFANTSVRSETRSLVFFDLTMISLTYASMIRLMSSPKMCRMHHWNVAPSFLSLKGIVL